MRESRDIVRSQGTEKAELERSLEEVKPSIGYRYSRYGVDDFRDQSPLLEYWRIIRKRLWLVLRMNWRLVGRDHNGKKSLCIDRLNAGDA